MSRSQLADLAEMLGPQTMVSRIGKMPMVVYETILGPLLDNGRSEEPCVGSGDGNQEYEDPMDSFKGQRRKGIADTKGSNPYKQKRNTKHMSTIPEHQRREVLEMLQKASLKLGSQIDPQFSATQTIQFQGKADTATKMDTTGNKFMGSILTQSPKTQMSVRFVEDQYNSVVDIEVFQSQ